MFYGNVYIYSSQHTTSPTFGNAINYVDDNAGWIRYRDIVYVINEELEKNPTVTSKDINKFFRVEKETLIIGNPVVGLDDVGNIPVESAFLLVYAADGDGQIMKTQTLDSHTQVSASGKQFMANNSKRESARWVEALDRLIEWGWVKAVGQGGIIFELTGTGYDKADWLKDNMGIDTSKDPLDELKEFEC